MRFGNPGQIRDARTETNLATECDFEIHEKPLAR